MPHVLIAGITLASAIIVAATAVPAIVTFARTYGLLDQPGDERRVHTRPVPRIGGIAMFLGFLVAVGVTLVLPVERFSEEVERITLLLIGATILVVVMFYDDVIGIGPLSKLGLQGGVALLVILPRLRDEQAGIVIERFNVPYFNTVELPLLAAFGFTAFWIVGMMNALNWSDGLDGLAATIALSASTVLFLHTYFWPRGNPQFTISLLAIALCGAIIGFLPWNWHPARTIMGDTGAMFLGFALATTSIIGGAKIATALLALGVPIVDMAWVIVNRVVHGRSPLTADRGHLHHRLLDAGWSQHQIVVTYGAVTLTCGAVGLVLPSREIKLLALIVIGIGVLIAIAALARSGGEATADGREALPGMER
jgi:UDP-N-acetylmuramyl pentapeptide phosphotransferase/UDP-N-acetylglucosamine-1-phosphate transferase